MVVKRTLFDWNQARSFLTVAEEGSLSAAARRLGLTQPTLSRQVAGLEDTLGVALFERTPRALVLTQAGGELLSHFREMGRAAQQISVVAAGQKESIVGHVVIAATELMATQYLPPIIEDLRKQAPRLTIEVVASKQLSDLRRREADIAIRHSQPQDKKLVARRLADIEATLFASRKYMKEMGRPTKLAHLSKMTFVGAGDHERLLRPLALRGLALTSSNFNFHADNDLVLLEFVRQGFGIGMLPSNLVKRYPELVEVWPKLKPLQFETWLASHREILTNPRIRLVFDLLAQGLG